MDEIVRPSYRKFARSIKDQLTNYVKDDYTIAEMAAALKRVGVKTPAGKPPSVILIAKMLRMLNIPTPLQVSNMRHKGQRLPVTSPPPETPPEGQNGHTGPQKAQNSEIQPAAAAASGPKFGGDSEKLKKLTERVERLERLTDKIVSKLLD